MKKNGTIRSLNVSPKGHYEGFLLETGKEIIQIKLPKDHLHGLDSEWQPDSAITVNVVPGEPRGTPAHKVFRPIRATGNNRPGASGKFTGRIVRLNYQTLFPACFTLPVSNPVDIGRS